MSNTGDGDATVGTCSKLSAGAGDDVLHSMVWPSNGLSATGSPRPVKAWTSISTKASTDTTMTMWPTIDRTFQSEALSW